MNQCIEMIFSVTERCMNGNEKKVHRSVYVPTYYTETDEQIVQKAIEVLKKNGYYNIKHIKSKTAKLMFVGDV